MYDPMFKPRGGFRGSPRGGRGRGGGGGGGWGGNQGYYGGGGGGGGQMDGYRGARGGYRGSRGGGGQPGGYRTNDTGGGYRGNFRGGYRGGMQQTGGYGGGRGGGYHTGGYGAARGSMGPRGGMTGNYRGGQNYRGGMDQSRGGQMNKGRSNTSAPFRKSDATLFEESLDLDKRRRMVKITLDNKISRADIEELTQTEGVTDLHISGHMIAEYKDEDEEVMLRTFQDVEQVTQNSIPCYADLTGKRSKNFGKEGVRDLKRVDVRNLPEKTSVDTVKEAFPGALAVWKNHKFNFIEMLFANEEEACEAILGGQQKEINGVLPYVMFHRENQADLTKRPREDDTTPQPAAKKVKKDVDVSAEKENGEGGAEEASAEADEENGGDEAEAAEQEEADE